MFILFLSQELGEIKAVQKVVLVSGKFAFLKPRTSATEALFDVGKAMLCTCLWLLLTQVPLAQTVPELARDDQILRIRVRNLFFRGEVQLMQDRVECCLLGDAPGGRTDGLSETSGKLLHVVMNARSSHRTARRTAWATGSVREAQSLLEIQWLYETKRSFKGEVSKCLGRFFVGWEQGVDAWSSGSGEL